ncbi:Glycine cleavage system H protein [uncultured Desulfobacterium sp.]|uniref:Glycine cleavage system H protein n=1 Tax=uncultured Desulfobacterium sp. TaxID=201089 RepID=A0A445MZ11_9BACT|nr:Glycine cleavage system H protein [uncultured Desulfobacterium sp.]
MTEISGYDMPDDLYYHKEHTWARVEYKKVRVGVTDFAARSAGDIVYVDLPFEGDEIKQGEPFGKMQSAKWIGELYAPISGEIVSVNDVLDRKPTLINESPYESGWIIVIRPSNLEEELKDLMTHETGLADWLNNEIERVRAEAEGV